MKEFVFIVMYKVHLIAEVTPVVTFVDTVYIVLNLFILFTYGLFNST
jgi:hypothetical protein